MLPCCLHAISLDVSIVVAKSVEDVVDEGGEEEVVIKTLIMDAGDFLGVV